MPDSKEQSGAVSYVIRVLKKVTRGAQIAPFVYLALLAFVLLCEPLLSDSVFYALNELFYISPAVFAIGFMLSKTLKLCVWHKAACSIPLVPQVGNYVDGYIVEFTQAEVLIINTTLGILTLAFIVCALRHFLHAGKANTD